MEDESCVIPKGEENKQMLSIIHDNFDNATVLMECLAKKWMNKEKVEESIQKTGAKFVFGMKEVKAVVGTNA